MKIDQEHGCSKMSIPVLILMAIAAIIAILVSFSYAEISDPYLSYNVEPKSCSDWKTERFTRTHTTYGIVDSIDRIDDDPKVLNIWLIDQKKAHWDGTPVPPIRAYRMSEALFSRLFPKGLQLQEDADTHQKTGPVIDLTYVILPIGDAHVTDQDDPLCVYYNIAINGSLR